MAGQASDLGKNEAGEYPYGPQAPVIPGTPTANDKEALMEGQGPFAETRGLALVALIGVSLCFGIGNLATFPLAWYADSGGSLEMLVFILIGAIFAQGGLVSAAIVFGPGSLWIRTVCCWSVSLLLWGCWAFGLLAFRHLAPSRSPPDWRETLQFVGLSLPLVALAIQSPLWFSRNYLGWRLTRSNQSNESARPLSIGDYLMGTAVTAVSVTFARMAPPSNWIFPGYWAVWAIVFACVAAASLLGVLPAMVLLLRWRNWPIGYCVFLLYGTVAGVTTVAILFAVLGPPGGPSPMWEVIGMCVMYISLAVFLGAGMAVARGYGYSLVTRRTRGK
jgi:hypothetical protein